MLEMKLHTSIKEVVPNWEKCLSIRFARSLNGSVQIKFVQMIYYSLTYLIYP